MALENIEATVEELRENTPLSNQEAKIFVYRENGLGPKEIAEELDISRSQVSVALNRISEKQSKAKELTQVLEDGENQSFSEKQSPLPDTGVPRQSPQVVLAPCVNDAAQYHFNDTVIKGVDVKDERIRHLVQETYSGSVPIWGTGEGNQASVEPLEPGDVVLFYVGDSTYSHFAIVDDVNRNPELAEELWEPYSGTMRKDETENWPWIIYLREPVKVKIDSEMLHDTLEWNQSYPLGFTRVADHRVDKLVSRHGSVRQYLEEAVVQHAAEGGGEVPTLDMSVDTEPEQQTDQEEGKSEPSLEELRERAESASSQEVEKTTTTSTDYSRSDAVREFALARADGICEACDNPAPFEKKNGDPYLEVHHLFKISDDGIDDPDSVVAICPTCHRRIHHGKDGNEYNRELIERYRDRGTEDQE